jgi:RNA polymerase sigma factor (sigma-70 family)
MVQQVTWIVMCFAQSCLESYRITMHNHEMYYALVDNDVAGLAAAFDHYAADLYAYCQSQLAEPADAADAVHDTFVIAASKITKLSEPDRLRSWLFAVTRNECHSRVQAGISVPAAMTYDSISLAGTSLEVQLRALVWAALARLEPVERELIELNLRHELQGADLADTLGVPRSQAQALAKRARSRFTRLLAVPLVAWPARDLCQDMAGILDSWDGRLTGRLRRRLASHIRRCPVCGRIKRPEINPAVMLTMLPAPALPGHLREQVLLLAGDISPDSVAFPGGVTHRMKSFGANGFAVQVTKPSGSRLPGSYVLAGSAVAALVLLGGGMLLASHMASHSGQPAAFESPRVTVTALPQANGFTKPLLVARSGSPASVTAPTRSSSKTASSNGQSSAYQPYSYSPTPTTAPTTILPPPTTAAPTTAAPTTAAPTTAAPTTAAPTTAAPTTAAPTTAAPTTAAPTTAAPTTAAPTTAAPTTAAPTTAAPTTAAPTTAAPTTAAPTTAAPTTAAPTTATPTTSTTGAIAEALAFFL